MTQCFGFQAPLSRYGAWGDTVLDISMHKNLQSGVSFVCASVLGFASGENGYNGEALQKRGANCGAKTRVTFCITRVPHTVAHIRIHIYIYIYITQPT